MSWDLCGPCGQLKASLKIQGFSPNHSKYIIIFVVIKEKCTRTGTCSYLDCTMYNVLCYNVWVTCMAVSRHQS